MNTNPIDINSITLIPDKESYCRDSSEVEIGNIFINNYNFPDCSSELLLELLNNNSSVIVPSFLRTSMFLSQESLINDSIYFSVSNDFEKEFELFKNLYSISKKEIKINISLNADNGDTLNAHQQYLKWKECSFVNKVMSAPIVTGKAALKCIDSGCDVLVIGFNDSYIQTTGVNIPILNSIIEVTTLMELADPTLLNEIELIANSNTLNPVLVSKLLSFKIDQVMLYDDLENVIESSNWEMPNLFQAIKMRSRKKVKTNSFGDLINPTQTCKELINQYNQNLKEILHCLGFASTQDLKETKSNNKECKYLHSF